MISRKAVKLTLFIFGAAVFVFWNVLFIMDTMSFTFGTKPLLEVSMLVLILIGAVAIVPMSIAMLMHAKDIIHKKKGFAVFLTIFSIIWLAGAALNLTAIIVITLVFGGDPFSFMMTYMPLGLL